MVSVGTVSLAEVWGEEMSAVVVEADRGSRLSLDVGLVVVVVVVVAMAVETEDEEATGVSGVIVEPASGGGGVAVAGDGIKDPEVGALVVTDSLTTWVIELHVADTGDMLVAAEGATEMEEMASPSATRGTTSRGSGSDNLEERPGDAAETGCSSVAAGRVSSMLVEGAATAESEVSEGLGVTDLGGVTVEEVGSSVGAAGPVGFAETLAAGSSVPLALASGTEGLVWGSASTVDAVAAESVHISGSEGRTVLEGAFEAGAELEIVATEAGAVAVRGRAAVAGGAAAGLGLVGVLVSASSIWDSSFSGVLRPDVAGGGPGLRTGFGSKAGFPADSCADALGRI